MLDCSLKWFFFIDFIVKSYHLSVMIISLAIAADGLDVNFAFAISKFAFWSLEAWCIYYHGNELIVKSLDITNKIFESNWYEHDLVVRNMFLIIMLRTKKPLQLHIGIFQTLSNDIMVKFFKAGYSVLAWSDKLKR
ncbi:odorant receptor 94a-like [Leptinotarsa decemlineata]|uniref:odorant receptor 94a-like n=1 Tax=Leptinotarsa decemlineata TaxID=7539 RepID=UPI003D30B521